MSGERFIRAAYAYLYIRDFKQALEAFGRAIEADPLNPDYYFHASVTALRNCIHEQALLWAEQAATLAPTNALYQEHVDVVRSAILVENAVRCLNAGDGEQALRYVHEAIERDPLNDTAQELMEQLEFTSKSSD